jgi:hypothetical protein
MYARCSVEDTPLSIHFGRWTSDGIGGTSAAAMLGSYAEPLDVPAKTTIGTTWTLVRIPMTVFFTADWASLAGPEWIYFNSDSLNRKCWVDNMYVRENVGPIVLGVSQQSETVLKVTMNKYFELQSARTLLNYYVKNPVDEATRLYPTDIGLNYRFQNFKDKSLVPRAKYTVMLVFAQPLPCDSANSFYTLVVANITGMKLI